MADTVTAVNIYEDTQTVVMAFTNQSDGTGEAAVKKVDVSTFNNSPVSMVIQQIQYECSGMRVNILEDATTDVVLYTVGSEEALGAVQATLVSSGTVTFTANGKVGSEGIGGLPMTGAAGGTGDIMFTTVGASATSSYAITLHLRKS
jgi:hypothetical protein